MRRFVNLAMTILTAAGLWGMQGCPLFPIEMAVEDTAELSISVVGCNAERQPTIVLIGESLSWDAEATSFGNYGDAETCNFHVFFTPSRPSLYRLRVSATHADGTNEAATDAFAQVSSPPFGGGNKTLQIVIEGGPDEDRVLEEVTIESIPLRGDS